MRKSWQLQEAKSKFSEVILRAGTEGPQWITKHGRRTAVVISSNDYDRLKRGNTSLAEFFQRSPLRGVDLDLERAKDLPREVEL